MYATWQYYEVVSKSDKYFGLGVWRNGSVGRLGIEPRPHDCQVAGATITPTPQLPSFLPLTRGGPKDSLILSAIANLPAKLLRGGSL